MADRRAYASPLRAAGAEDTRRRVLVAARITFEEHGWAGATLGAIAAEAGVSPKTVQAQFRTKAGVLAATVDFALRGEATPHDRGETASPRRVSAREIRTAGTAEQALTLHARMVTEMGRRTAGLAAVVEAGAAADPSVAQLWERMQESLRFAVAWAAETVLEKPGVRAGLTAAGAETVFEIAMARSTHRILASRRAMSPQQIEAWIGELYERMLLA